MPYDFTSEGYSQFSQDVINAGGDQATLTALLADMQGTYTENIAKGIAQEERVTTVEAENQRLRDSNMALFLRVGQQAVQQTGEIATGQPEEKPMSTAEYMNKYFETLDKK